MTSSPLIHPHTQTQLNQKGAGLHMEWAGLPVALMTTLLSHCLQYDPDTSVWRIKASNSVDQQHLKLLHRWTLTVEKHHHHTGFYWINLKWAHYVDTTTSISTAGQLQSKQGGAGTDRKWAWRHELTKSELTNWTLLHLNELCTRTHQHNALVSIRVNSIQALSE